jgi:hypothetical protein
MQTLGKFAVLLLIALTGCASSPPPEVDEGSVPLPLRGPPPSRPHSLPYGIPAPPVAPVETLPLDPPEVKPGTDVQPPPA